MVTISISTLEVNGKKVVRLQSPYHRDLPDQAKALGGKFDPREKAWLFDPRDERRVREMARKIYGTDGEGVTKTVTIRLDLDKYGDKYGDAAEIWFGGRMVAARKYRDSEVRLGDGVIIASGGFPSSGGSAKHPRLSPKSGTVLEVRDVPETLVPQEDWLEIVPLDPKPEKLEELIQRRERLQAELELVEEMIRQLTSAAF